MKKEEILKNLKSGNYNIKLESDCGCCIDWNINFGELQPDISSDCCWVGNVLYINDEPIIEQLAYEPLETVKAEMTTREFREMLEENNLEYIIDEMQFDEDHTENEAHNNKLAESLKDFITNNKYSCYINYPRNFANEYTCILVDKDADIDDIPENARKIDIEEFVEEYLQKDDACTKYYISFMLIK